MVTYSSSVTLGVTPHPQGPLTDNTIDFPGAVGLLTLAERQEKQIQDELG